MGSKHYNTDGRSVTKVGWKVHENIISVVNDFLNQWDPSITILMEEVLLRWAEKFMRTSYLLLMTF